MHNNIILYSGNFTWGPIFADDPSKFSCYNNNTMVHATCMTQYGLVFPTAPTQKPSNQIRQEYTLGHANLSQVQQYVHVMMYNNRAESHCVLLQSHDTACGHIVDLAK